MTGLGRYRHHIAVAAAFLGAILISWAIASSLANAIETHSRSSVERMLNLGGFDWVNVQADGLQVVLEGEAPDESARIAAQRAAVRVVDASRLIDAMEIAVARPVRPPTFSLELLQNEAGISLFGLVPESTGTEAVVDRIQRAKPQSELTEILDQADYPPPATWPLALEYGIKALAEVKRAKISITADRVDIRANAESAEEKKRLEAALKRGIPDGVEVAIEIGAPRPVVSPYTLRFLIDDRGARFDACTTDTPEGSEAILQAARDAGMTGPATCTLGLGVPSADWDEAARLAIEAVGRLGGGNVTFSNADVSLIGKIGTDPATFDKIIGELRADLPEVYSLTAELPPPPKEDGQDAPPEFLATLSPEGLVQLRGVVPDERSRNAVLSFAHASFGRLEINEALRIREGLPSGWPVRVLASIEALAQLSNGFVETGPDLVEVKGQTGHEDANSMITGILSERIGDGQNFELAVEYVEKLDPLADLPTPEECVAQINAVLAVQKIIFAPSSADIDDIARASIENIADIMKNCADVPMEVGGHTDSQGRETMNKELSQARADAVVNALLARRVLTSNLTAVGYGEEVPIADNDTEEGREANRRIEFKLLLPPEEEVEETASAAEDAEATDQETEGETPAEETNE